VEVRVGPARAGCHTKLVETEAALGDAARRHETADRAGARHSLLGLGAGVKSGADRARVCGVGHG
jgi:hypothetical protein